MKNVKFSAARGAFILLAIGSMGLSPAVPHGSALNVVSASRVETAVDVTTRDVAASNRKVRMAHTSLANMWTGYFRDAGHEFAVSRTGSVSRCCLIRMRFDAA